MKYKPERDLPDFARELKTLSPSKLALRILERRNDQVDPSAITHWFKRHPDVEEKLRLEIAGNLPDETQTVDLSVFENGSFQEVPSVKNWILEMNARDLDQETITGRVAILKQLCQGRFSGHKLDFIASGKWCLKHPDRLHMTEAMEILSLLKEKGVDSTGYKSVLKNFLTSKGEVVGSKIAVGRSRSYGKYARLHVELDILAKMLNCIKPANFAAYVADLFMLKTATRVSATLNAKIEDLTILGDHAEITVYDKGRHSKYPLGHPWQKRIDVELLGEIVALIQGRTKGKIFEGLDSDTLGTLNHKAIEMFAPETLARYPDLAPNHFWRHNFAQTMLRKTDWNYGVVANLGGWTTKALEESYGMPPDQVVKQWAEKYHLDIAVSA